MMPTRRSSALVLLFLILTMPSLLVAEPDFQVVFDRFTDTDGDKVLDCGEPVRFRVSVEEELPNPSSVSGSVTIPSSRPTGWIFTPGTVTIDPTYTVRCLGGTTIPTGNSVNDTFVRVDYRCSTDTAPNDGYVLVFYVTGTYWNVSGTSITLPATNSRTLPSALLQQAAGTTYGAEPCSNPDLALSKSDGGITASPGSLVSYVLRTQNNGSRAAQNVVLRETVPAHTVFEPASSAPGWSCAPGYTVGSTCTLNLGTIVAGGTVSPVFAVRVDIPSGTTQLTNTAFVSTEGDPNDRDNTATDLTPVDPGVPDLALTKTLTSGSGNPGSTNIYTLTVRNTGVATAAAVTLTETIPQHARFSASGSTSGWSCSPSSGGPGASCTFSAGALTPNANRAVAFALRIDDTLPAAATALTNSACSTTSTAGDPPANNCSSTTTPLGGSPAISISKALASGTATPGSTLTWSLTLRNTGNREATSAVLQETVPAATTFSATASSPGWTCTPGTSSGATCTLNLSSLVAGAQVSRNFAVILDNPLPAGVTEVGNTACATAPSASRTCDTIRTPTNGAPSLAVTKTLASGSGAPGSVLIYRLAIKNSGNQAATSVSLSETVPAHTAFDSAGSSAGWNCTGTAAGSTCTLALGSLAGGGATVNKDFAVRIASPLPAGVTAITNRACATSPAATANCDDEVTPTSGSPILAISKRLTGPQQVTPGALLTYDIQVANTGNQDAQNVVISDQVPAPATFDATSSSPGWSCTPAGGGPLATCKLTIDQLKAGASRTFRIAMKLPAPLPSGINEISNTACVGASCSTATTPIEGSPAVRVEKSYSGPPLSAGSLLSFAIAVTNSGDQHAAGVVVTETVPAYSTFAPASSTPGWSCTAPKAGSKCTFTISTLQVGEIRDLIFAVRADSRLPGSLAQISNAVCVSISTGGSTCDDVSTPLPVGVELDLVDAILEPNPDKKTGPGDTLLYTLYYSNPTSGPARDVVISFNLDRYLTFVAGSVKSDLASITTGNGPKDKTVLLTLPSLEPGQSGTTSFRAVIGLVPADVRTLSSQARASGSNFTDEPSNDPETPVDDDPTLTPLRVLSPTIHDIPTLDVVGLLFLTLALSLFGLRFIRP